MAIAQEVPNNPSETAQPSTAANPLGSLAGEFLHGDFVNVYGFVNGTYDSTQQTLQTANQSGGGFGVGGGITASKTFSSGVLSVNYRGSYQQYSAGFDQSGTNQYLSLTYSRQLGRRWLLSFTETAGILFYSNAFYGTLAPSGGSVQTNPFSPSTRFLQSGVYLSYRQTQRLTYTFGGNFFLDRYNYAGAIGSTGAVGSGSVSYMITARTSVGGTYSHDYFVFQRGTGTTELDGGFGNISHLFGRSWRVYASGGLTHTQTHGVVQLPVEFISGGQLIPGYVTGSYNTSGNVPTFQGGVSRHFGRFDVSASGGHGVSTGNGTIFTSSSTYFGGVISRRFGRTSVVSANAYYSRISSIANKVSDSYSQTYLTFAYSRMLIPHVSTFANYSYIRYGALLNYGSSIDNRFAVGLSFSSKSIPLTLF